MLEKITKIILITAGFVLTLHLVANIIDADLGWHLRFGMDAFAGQFQYTDSYTWTNFGEPWTNHEWGSDLFFWLIYADLGYFALSITIAVIIWLAFLWIVKIFTNKLSPLSILLAIFCVWSLDFIFAVRPAFVVLALIPPLIYTLKVLPQKNLLYLWPFIFWLWSILHGSWFIGFIITFIYIGGNLFAIILKRYFPLFSGKETNWSAKTFFTIAIWLVISAIAVLANPYGLKIYGEIAAYISQGTYFKTIINEWIPSYAYPVYLLPLIIGSVAAVFAVIGYKNKRLSLAELLLFAAFFYAAWSYKRNNLYLVFFSLPIISIALTEAEAKIMSLLKLNKVNLKIIRLCIYIAFGLIIIAFNASSIYVSSDIWTDPKYLAHRPYPYQATLFLKQEGLRNNIFLFNEFRWGGYLNWSLPEALVYLDGRGTVTWNNNEGMNLLKKYRQMKFEINGLRELNSTQANYAIINRNISSYPKPNVVNRIIFSNRDLSLIHMEEESQLEKMLTRSNEWILVYEDQICRIWKKI